MPEPSHDPAWRNVWMSSPKVSASDAAKTLSVLAAHREHTIAALRPVLEQSDDGVSGTLD